LLKFIANKKPKIDGAFIKELYKLVLGREAENAEVVNSKLVYKDRFTLVKHFLESDEFQQIVSTKNYSFLHQAEGVLTQKNGFSFVFPSNDTCQLQEIISHGSYQHQELKTAFAYLREKNFLDGNILFDIGANVGTHSIYALNEPEINHVIAVEPSKRNVEFLKMNLLLNQVADKVDIVISAVGDKNSCATLIKSPNNCGDYRLSSTVTSGNLQNEETFETETVSVVTLDNLLDKYDCKKIALFWIDTHGSEGLILGDSKKISEISY
jgi:FkbM family methyltransferase